VSGGGAVIRFKPEVRIRRFTSQLGEILALASTYSALERIEIEVNSIDDTAPNRSPTTLHGYGLAIDLDTANDKPQELEPLAEFLRRTLDPQYDVLLEGNHVHVEWDARRGPLRRLQ